jgi:hypothetical protein
MLDTLAVRDHEYRRVIRFTRKKKRRVIRLQQFNRFAKNAIHCNYIYAPGQTDGSQNILPQRSAVWYGSTSH